MTLFPEMVDSALGHSIPRRAQDKGLLQVCYANIRDFAEGNYNKVDDTPYGGGPGMVMKPGPVMECYEHTVGLCDIKPRTIIMTPAGKKLDQALVKELSQEERLILIAGRYEGFDERIIEGIDAECVSVGDYVLSGGELGAMIIIDAVARLLDGVLGDSESSVEESFSNGLLEYPQYTRPDEYRGMKVPEVLLSGDHKKIAEWRKEKSIEKTRKFRPDLLL